jgi:eukaryotic-like serine/threonine-protein kinase
MPAPEPGEEAAAPRKRSPWTWPLVALIILLVLVLGGTIWALLANQQPAPAPTSSSATPSPSASTPTPSPSATRIDIDALNLVGMQCDQAVQTAKSAGVLEVVTNTDTPAPDDSQVGVVWRVNPTGNIEPTTSLTVSCYGQVTPIGGPSNPPAIQGGAPAEAGSTVTLTWDSFTCPTGTGTLSGYTVTLQNAVFTVDGTSQRDFPPNDRDEAILIANAAGQTLTASYTALCSGTEQRRSDASPQMQVQIQPASSPSPTP